MPEKSKKRVVIILQARMGAARLPGKPLKTVLGRPLLSYQLERLRQAKLIDEIVVATTTQPQDDQIAAFCADNNVPCFRGSEHDVLDRYYQAAKRFKADEVVRITGDCPLIDPVLVDQVVRQHLKEHKDYTSNSLERTYPRGLDTEIFSFRVLEKAAKEAVLTEEREHVTLYFYTHPELFSLGSVKESTDRSNHRWTVDTIEDFTLVAKILSILYPKNPDFRMKDILELLEKHPDWMKINAHIQQKPVKGHL
jgi:spore coat polysaccharide biosynthesis protein SpsF